MKTSSIMSIYEDKISCARTSDSFIFTFKKGEYFDESYDIPKKEISLNDKLQPTFPQKVLLILRRNNMSDIHEKLRVYLESIGCSSDLKFEDKLYLAFHDEKNNDLHERIKLMYKIGGLDLE